MTTTQRTLAAILAADAAYDRTDYRGSLDTLTAALQTAESSGTVTRVSLRDAVEAYEKDIIQDTLKTTRGNRAKAARLLDTTERVLNYKVRQLAIDYQRFKL